MLAKMADMDAEDPLYDELYANYDGLIRGFTTELVDLDSQIREIKASIDSNGARRESVERVKEIINTMWDHLDMLPQEYVKQFMNSFIDNIQIYEEPDRIDGVNFWVKSLRFKVPMFKGTPNEFDTIEFRREFQPNGEHGETVCLLSKLHEAKHHVSVKLEMDEMDITSAENKATYEEIKKYVAEHNDGMKASSLNIAQVKAKYGIIERENYNKAKSEEARQPVCPKDKEEAIVEALKAFRMI
jgi:site-specific DNA recombinase